jgi:prevent-host-death family protein
MEVNIHEAKTHFSRLIEKALTGEDIVIAKAGRPLVRLTVIPPKPTRELGTAAGLITWKAGWEKALTATELDEFMRVQRFVPVK